MKYPATAPTAATIIALRMPAKEPEPAPEGRKGGKQGGKEVAVSYSRKHSGNFSYPTPILPGLSDGSCSDQLSPPGDGRQPETMPGNSPASGVR